MNTLTVCAFGKKKKVPANFFIFGIVIVVSADDTEEILDFISVINIGIKKTWKNTTIHLQDNFIYTPVFTPSVWTSSTSHL